MIIKYHKISFYPYDHASKQHLIVGIVIFVTNPLKII